MFFKSKSASSFQSYLSRLSSHSFGQTEEVQEVDVDVVIVGAGLSGLVAAYKLLQTDSNISFTIVEAGDRIGGRLRSKDLKNAYFQNEVSFDLGGQFFSYEQRELLDLLKELNLQVITEDLTNNHDIVIVDCQRPHFVFDRQNIYNFLSTADRLFLNAFILKVNHLSYLLLHNDKETIESLKSISMQEFLNRYLKGVQTKYVVKQWLLTYCGHKAEDVSALFYVNFCASTRGIETQMDLTGLYNSRLEQNTTSLCKELLEKHLGSNNLLKNERVKKIICQDNHIKKVVTNKQRICCRAVIVAISPQDVLKLQITPPLSVEKESSLQDLVIRPVIKFLLVYNKAFWKDFKYTGEILIFKEKPQILFCFDGSTDGFPAIVGQLVLEENSRVPYKDFILRELVKYLGTNVLSYIHFEEVKWKKGIMSGWKVGNNFLENFKKPHNGIYFAGAESSTHWYGLMAGAVFAGFRAATEVLYELRPSSLTVEDMVTLSPIQQFNIELKEENDPFYRAILKWYIYAPVTLLVLFFVVRYGRRKFFS